MLLPDTRELGLRGGAIRIDRTSEGVNPKANDRINQLTWRKRMPIMQPKFRQPNPLQWLVR